MRYEKKIINNAYKFTKSWIDCVTYSLSGPGTFTDKDPLNVPCDALGSKDKSPHKKQTVDSIKRRKYANVLKASDF